MSQHTLDKDEAIQWLTVACTKAADARNANPELDRPTITLPRDIGLLSGALDGSVAVMGASLYGNRADCTLLSAEAAICVALERFPGYSMVVNGDEDGLLIKDVANGTVMVAIRPSVVGAKWVEAPVVQISRLRPRLPVETLRRIGQMSVQEQKDILATLVSE